MPRDLYQQAVAAGLLDPQTRELTPFGNAIDELGDDPKASLLEQAYKRGMIDRNLSLTDKGNLYAGGRDEAIASKERFAEWNRQGFEKEYEEQLPEQSGLFGRILKSFGNAPAALQRAGIVPQDPIIAGVFELANPSSNKGLVERTRERMESNKNTRDENLIVGSEFATQLAEGYSTIKRGPKTFVAKHFLEDEDYWEAKRQMELAADDIRDTEAAAHLLRYQMIAEALGVKGTVDDENIQHAIDAVNEAYANVDDETKARLIEDATSISLVSDPIDAPIEVGTMGAGKLATMGMKARMLNRMTKLAEAEARLKLTGHAAKTLRKQREVAMDLIVKGTTPGARAAAGRTVQNIDEALAAAEKAAQAAAETAKRVSDGGRLHQAWSSTKLAGRKLVGAPLRKIGQLTENLGSGMTKMDDAIKARLADSDALTVYNAARLGLKALPGVGAGVATMGPAGVVVGALAALDYGKFIQKLGKNLQVLGIQHVAERTSVPFWRRVAEDANSSMVQKASARMIDWGRRTQLADVAQGAAGGAAAGAGLGYVLSGGEKEGAASGAAMGTVFGTIGGVGGAIVKGSDKMFQARQLMDLDAFRREISDVRQRDLFGSMSTDAQRLIAHKAAVFPDLRVEFTDSGSGRFDGATNTVYINTKSRNPIKPLISHEVSHFVVDQGLADVVATRILDLVKTDEGYTANFEKFSREYNERLKAAALARGDSTFRPLDEQDMAIEYAIEGFVDDLLGMADSGRLGKAASGPTVLGDLERRFLENVLPRVPILGRIFRNMGTLMDKKGRLVKGTGFLAEGVMSDPATRRMLRNMAEELAGRRAANVTRVDPETGRKTTDKGGIPYEQWITDKTLHEKAPGIFRQDKDGNIIYQDGKPIPLTKREMDKADAEIGQKIVDELESMTEADMAALPEGHVKIQVDPENGARIVSGRFLSDELVGMIERSGLMNTEQLKNLRALNNNLKEYDGSAWSFLYHPALRKRGRGRNKSSYAPLAIKETTSVPVGITITKDGNILIQLFDVQHARKNAEKLAKRKRGRELWGGEPDKIMRDLQTHMENWQNNVDNKAFWQAQLGKEKGLQKHQALNAIAGYTNKTHLQNNPFFADYRYPGETATFRTYRLDRLNKGVRLDGAYYPYDYRKVTQGMAPEPTNKRPKTIDNQEETGRIKVDDKRGKGRGDPQGMGQTTLSFAGRERRPLPAQSVVDGVGEKDVPGYSAEVDWAEVDSSEARVKNWSEANGRHFRRDQIEDELGPLSIKGKGSEHSVWKKGGKWVKVTSNDGFGFPNRTPTQYLRRMSDVSSFVPEAAWEFLGTSENSRGVLQIWSVQNNVAGRKPKDLGDLIDAMSKAGWEYTGDNYVFVNRETKVKIHDAHEDNVVIGADGRAIPFDVWFSFE